MEGTQERVLSAVSDLTVGRLSLYRRVLNDLIADDVPSVYSHELGKMAGVTAAQVRRDLMVVGYTGSSTRGYDVPALLESIRKFLDAPGGQGIALVGIGKLGRALMSYFAGRRPNLRIVAAFDVDPYKANRVIHGCRCYPMSEMASVVSEKGIRAAVLTVPASEAQTVADALATAGVTGILNFAPARLHMPRHVYVEYIDVTTAMETIAYFARTRATVHKGTAR